MAAPSLSGTIMPQPQPAAPRLLDIASRLRRNPSMRGAFLRTFRWLQQRGVCITPNHFYWPIPDLNSLSSREWPRQPEVFGIDFNLDRQCKLLDRVIAPYSPEWTFPDRPADDPATYHYNNGLFETIDAEVAYSLVRSLRPRRIVEIGGGYSTRIMASAINRNEQEFGEGCELLTMDLHPEPILQRGFPGLSRVIAGPVQQAGLDIADWLEAGDFLFIDSSHVVAVGSDVVYEFLEVLPRLRNGVVVHVHDIFLPSDYPRASVLEGLCFWSEQYLLQAFLSFNRDFEVLWASSAMQMRHADKLSRVFPWWNGSYLFMPEDRRQFIPTYDGYRVWPSSLWMRRRYS